MRKTGNRRTILLVALAGASAMAYEALKASRRS